MDDRSSPARWSRLGEQNIGTIVRLAEAGNVDAGRRLIALATRLLRDRQPFPHTLADWCADRLEAIAETPDISAGQHLRVSSRRGAKPEHADNMHAALYLETVKARAARVAFNEISVGVKPLAAFHDVAEWLESIGDINRRTGRPYAANTIASWYADRKAALSREARARKRQHRLNRHIQPITS